MSDFDLRQCWLDHVLSSMMANGMHGITSKQAWKKLATKARSKVLNNERFWLTVFAGRSNKVSKWPYQLQVHSGLEYDRVKEEIKAMLMQYA